MDTFEYLSVLISVVIGLGVVHVLQGVGRVISLPKLPKLYWIHTVWVVQSLLFLFYFWWFQLGYRGTVEWTSALFAFVLLYAIALYLQCAIIVPDTPQPDYERYFHDKARWFYAIVLLVLVLDGVDTHLKPEGVGLDVSVTGTVVLRSGFAALLLLAMYTKKRWYHGLIALIWFVAAAGSLLGRPEP